MDLQTPAGVRHPLSGLTFDDDGARAEEYRKPPPDFVDKIDVKDIVDVRDRPDVVDFVDVKDRPDVVDFVDVKDRPDIVDIRDIRDRPDFVDVIERPQ